MDEIGRNGLHVRLTTFYGDRVLLQLSGKITLTSVVVILLRNVSEIWIDDILELRKQYNRVFEKTEKWIILNRWIFLLGIQ